MAAFCIPKDLAKTLKGAAKRGEFKIAEMAEMSSDQRRALFEKYTDNSTAKQINAGFERAIISNRQDALQKWATRVFSGDKKSPIKKSIEEKIKELDEMGVLDPLSEEQFLKDLVSYQLGVTVTPSEIKRINELTAKVEEAYNKDWNNFGNPSDEYFQARSEMDNYLQSLSPAPKLKIVTSTIGRAAMLASVKSPLTNIVGNSVMGVVQSTERRLAAGSLGGSNNDLVLDYVRYATDIYAKTGYDIVRVTSLRGNDNTLGENVIHSQGEGKTRWVGRVAQDVVFNKLMGQPDIAFAAANFADSANILSSQIAKKEGLKGEAAKARAREIFLDATAIEPKTEEGIAVRDLSIADSAYATFTNDSVYSNMSLELRGILNKYSGDIRLGDQLMPFVKTPANVIGVGIDAAGLGAIKALYNLPSAYKLAQQGELGAMRGVIRDATRTGLGLTLALILANLFDPEDFIGEYPISQKERELLELQNATTNSIKIGDRWVSLDYFGAIAAPLVGIMYARKYGNGWADGIYKYSKGVGIQSAKIPGFEQFYDTIKTLREARPESDRTVGENIAALQNSAIDYMRSRLVPALVSDIARISDDVERDTSTDNDKFAKLKNSLPILRQTLPPKTTIFGEEIKTEPGLSVLLFGSRVKTRPDSKVLTEFERLAETGNLPSITDPAETSPRVKDLRSQIGDEKFFEAMKWYGQNYKERTDRLISSGSYKTLPDDEKAERINKVKEESLEYMLKKYGYRKIKPVSGNK